MVVQTPGVSQFFGCTPLGPVGWTIGAGSALGATFANGALTKLVERLPGSGPDRTRNGRQRVRRPSRPTRRDPARAGPAGVGQPEEVGSRRRSAEVTFIGTATTVLRIGGFTLLTDPNFLHRGQRAYLGKGLWSRRRTDPALRIAQLPSLDAVVLSHLHGDHFDRVARRELDRRAAHRHHSRGGAEAASLGLPGRRGAAHLDSRELHRDGDDAAADLDAGTARTGRAGPLMPDVMGTMIDLERDGPREFRLYVTGDTLNRPMLAEIPERYPDIDAMLIHLGGTRVAGILLTMDARQGADLVELVRPEAHRADPLRRLPGVPLAAGGTSSARPAAAARGKQYAPSPAGRPPAHPALLTTSVGAVLLTADRAEPRHGDRRPPGAAIEEGCDGQLRSEMASMRSPTGRSGRERATSATATMPTSSCPSITGSRRTLCWPESVVPPTPVRHGHIPPTFCHRVPAPSPRVPALTARSSPHCSSGGNGSGPGPVRSSRGRRETPPPGCRG